jgi:type II secretory pathway component PulF
MGANLTEAFDKIRKNISDKSFRDSVDELKVRMEQGSSLSEAMKEESKLFPPDYVKMIEAAEETDSLPHVLYDLSKYLETVEFTRSQVKSAAFYPCIIINFAFIFVFFIYYVFSDILFNQYVNFSAITGQELDGLSYLFINIGKILYSPAFIAAMFLAVIFLDVIIFSRSTAGTNIFIKLPVIGEIFRKAYIVRLSRALGFMLKQGITLDKSLELAAKTSDSSQVKNILMKASEKVSQGKNLGYALEGVKFFDDTFLFIIKHGEKTGTLPSALFDGADYYEDEMKMLYSGMMKFSEPFFIITAGIIVGFLLISVFKPFYSITGAIH